MRFLANQKINETVMDEADLAERRREALRRFLASQPLSQGALLSKAGVSESTVYSFLRGSTASLSARTYGRLALASGVPESIIRGDDFGRALNLAGDNEALTHADMLALCREFSQRIPLDVAGLAKALGLRVVYADLADTVSGSITATPGASPSGYTVTVNQWHPRTRKRFTLAHEIAHFVLHRDIIGDGIKDDGLYRSGLPSRVEREANRFAADLLMPPDKLPDLKTANVADLAEQFQVSCYAMAIQLGVPYEP